MEKALATKANWIKRDNDAVANNEAEQSWNEIEKKMPWYYRKKCTSTTMIITSQNGSHSTETKIMALLWIKCFTLCSSKRLFRVCTVVAVAIFWEFITLHSRSAFAHLKFFFAMSNQLFLSPINCEQRKTQYLT